MDRDHLDSQVAIHEEDKSVIIRYDTPFIKGLGMPVEMDELNKHGGERYRSLQTSYKDAYTAETRELYEVVVNRKEIKTSAADTMDDMKLFKMMMDKYPKHKRQRDNSGSSSFLPSGP